MASRPSGASVAPGQVRERDRQVQRPSVRPLGGDVEGPHRVLARERRPRGRGSGSGGHEAGERLPHHLVGGLAEDALGGGVPAADIALAVHRDDRVARGGDELLEVLLGLRHLAVQARVADGDGQVVRQHLEQLALAGVDGTGAGPVGHREVPEDVAVLADRADHAGLPGLALGRRRAQAHRRLLVAEGVLELRGDRGGELAEIELAEQAARDLAQDRELGDPQGLVAAARCRVSSSRLRALVASERISSTSAASWLRVPSSVCRRARARRAVSSRSWRLKGLIRYSKAPWVSAFFTVSSEA